MNTTTPQHKLLALADRLALIPAITDWADDSLDAVERELRAVAATLPPDHSVDANKMVATDNLGKWKIGYEAYDGGICFSVTDIASGSSCAFYTDSDRIEDRFVCAYLRDALATHPPQQEPAASGVELPAMMEQRRFRDDDPEGYGYVRGWNACRDVIEGQLARAAAPAAPATPESAEPVAWIRYCSDGTYEGPLHNSDKRMDDYRRKSGAWSPLYTHPTPAASDVGLRKNDALAQRIVADARDATRYREVRHRALRQLLTVYPTTDTSDVGLDYAIDVAIATPPTEQAKTGDAK